MTKSFSIQNLYFNITLALLILALAIKAGAGFQWLFPNDEPVYNLSHIQQAYPNVHSYSLESDNSISVYDSNAKELGKALITSEMGTTKKGYGGSLPLLIPINQQNELGNVVLLKNAETKKIISFLEHKDFFSSWLSVPADSNALNLNIDAVSAATITTDAIIQGVNGTLATYLAVQAQQKSEWKKTGQLIAVALIIIFALIMLITGRFKRYYYFHLTAVLLVLGIWTRKMLSIDLVYIWLKSGLPWHNNSELVIILLLSISMALLGRKKFYCNYICPMGALQMLVSKLSPIKKHQLPRKVLKLDIRNLYLAFIWACLICGLTLPFSSIEPFMAFAYELAGWFLIGFGLLIIALSLFFNRPWCTYCPTGCALDLVLPLKTNRNEE